MMSQTPRARTQANGPGEEATPWWRFPIVWMVIAGPLIVVVAGVSTAVIAVKGADPVLTMSAPVARAGEAPAMQARNKAAENAVSPARR